MRQCVFCGATPVTREHVIPEWIANYLSVNHMTVNVTDDAGRRTWTTVESFNFVARIVCARCNGGWMAELENNARPLLLPLFDGTEVVLSIQEQGVIARWLWKTAVVTAVAQRRTYFSHDELRGMIGIQEPTGDFLRLSIGTFADPPYVAHADVRQGTGRKEGMDAVDTFAFYLQIKRVVFEAIHIRGNGLAITGDARLEQFWPPDGPLMLPRPVALSAVDYAALVSTAAHRPIGFLTPSEPRD